MISVTGDVRMKGQGSWDVRTPESPKLCAKCSRMCISLRRRSMAFMVLKEFSEIVKNQGYYIVI